MFNTADFPDGYAPDPKIDNNTYETCRYRGFRTPNTTSEEHPYTTNMMYWHVFGARLAFVAVFEVREFGRGRVDARRSDSQGNAGHRVSAAHRGGQLSRLMGQGGRSDRCSEDVCPSWREFLVGWKPGCCGDGVPPGSVRGYHPALDIPLRRKSDSGHNN